MISVFRVMHRSVRVAVLGALIGACATAPVYHTVADVSAHCKRSGHAVFSPYADCINATLGDQFGFDHAGIAQALAQLKQEVRAGRTSDAAAISAFETRYYRHVEPVDWQGGLRTALAVGAVVGVVALIAAGAASGVSPNVIPSSDYRYLNRHSLRGCCSGHGGLALEQITGQGAQCADGTTSRTCFFDGARLHPQSQSSDSRGCCSWHEGICGSVGHAVLCCDLEISPTCLVR